MLKRWDGRRSQRTDATIRREYARAVADPAELSERHPRQHSATAAALAVHLLTLALLTGAVAIWFTHIATGFKVFITIVLGGVGLVVAPLRRPRRLPGWTRSEAPYLFDLIDAAASRLGVRSPQRVLATADYRVASDGRTLRLGLPLWSGLAPDGRHAMLAHGVALGARDDPRLSPLVTTAGTSIADWLYLLRPNAAEAARRPPRRIGGLGRESQRGVGIGEMLLPIVLAPVLLVVLALQAGMRAGLLPAGQRAGYRAVQRAAEVAGVTGVLEMLQALLMSARVSAETAVAVRRGDTDVADVGRVYLAVLDPAILDAVGAQSRESAQTPVADGPPVVFLADFVRTMPVAPVTTPVEALAAADGEMQRAHDEVNATLRARAQAEQAAAPEQPTPGYPS